MLLSIQWTSLTNENLEESQEKNYLRFCSKIVMHVYVCIYIYDIHLLTFSFKKFEYPFGIKCFSLIIFMLLPFFPFSAYFICKSSIIIATWQSKCWALIVNPLLMVESLLVWVDWSGPPHISVNALWIFKYLRKTFLYYWNNNLF